VNAGDITSVAQLLNLRGPRILDDRRARFFCFKTGMTPFLRAAEKGHTQIMTLMFEKYGPSILEQTDLNDKWTALHFAATAGRTAAVSQLLAWDPKLLDARTMKFGETPFIGAARCGQVDTMRAMHSKGGNDILTQQDSDGATALDLAGEGNHREALAQLLAWGGAPLLEMKNNDRDRQGLAPAPGATPFIACTKLGGSDALEAMYAKGGKHLLTQQAKDGNTALHCAVSRVLTVVLFMGMPFIFFGNRRGPKLVAKLLEWGGAGLLEIKNNQGKTPLEMPFSAQNKRTMRKYKGSSLLGRACGCVADAFNCIYWSCLLLVTYSFLLLLWLVMYSFLHFVMWVFFIGYLFVVVFLGMWLIQWAFWVGGRRPWACRLRGRDGCRPPAIFVIRD